MENRISNLLAEMRAARFFEDASASALRAIVAVARESLATGKFAKRTRIVRSMVHLRPEGGYRRLAVLEAAAEGDVLAPVAPKAAHVPSATAWRWAAQHACPVSIDVSLGTISPHFEGAVEVFADDSPFTGQESQKVLLSRSVTHVLALPLRGRHSVDGMITLEAECRPALGEHLLWGAGGQAMQLLADVATPYLNTLPPEPRPEARPDAFLPVIGPSIAGAIEILRVFAQQDETVLLSGPTGAGKSRLARWCHEQSGRKTHPFESMDLVAVPENLQMAELFGWKRGAFSGAVKDNPGYLARARGGTLFIDEIDKLPLQAQAGILNLLEERTYRSLGDDASDHRADVRFIVGTNVDLQAAVRSGAFREDLYYRVNVLPVFVPPLDERRDEIALWANYMAERRHRDTGKQGRALLSPEAERKLCSAQWPGNLRQLDNIVRRAYALALLDYGQTPADITLTEHHFERALAYDTGRDPVETSVIDLLSQAASALVAELERQNGSPKTVDLDLLDAFRGFVLAAGALRFGREDVFRRLNREALVDSRNHHKAFRRELDRIETLCKTLGYPPPAAFAELLAGK